MKPYKRILKSLLIIALFLLSTMWINPLPAQPPPKEHPPDDPPPFEDMQFNGTFIAWNREEDTTKEQWSWQSQAWEFGPYPARARDRNLSDKLDLLERDFTFFSFLDF